MNAPPGILLASSSSEELMLRAGMLSRIVALVLLGLPLAGCELAGGIFKAGAWVGAMAVIVVVVAIVFLAGKLRS
jgi:hypothetical protein